MTYVITSPCIDCVDGACMTACPVDCIHPSERMFYIDPVTCVDCGACESLCPVEAIYKSRWVPSDRAGVRRDQPGGHRPARRSRPRVGMQDRGPPGGRGRPAGQYLMRITCMTSGLAEWNSTECQMGRSLSVHPTSVTLMNGVPASTASSS